mmetsp:Transcript_27020/g.39515  ORF Transcript_27020/g.39515 Transcript_27020/m.39515 type:complete len:129 (-) Transcript_27020:179-565(-)
MADGYDPRRSKVSNDTMEKWRIGAITGNLQEVPGIGPAAAKKLAAADEPITNTYQLFGKYLMMKGPDSDGHKVETIEHCEKFWHFLASQGISAHRSAIVKAIAEKSATYFGGIYDASMWDDDEDEDDE